VGITLVFYEFPLQFFIKYKINKIKVEAGPTKVITNRNEAGSIDRTLWGTIDLESSGRSI
jgi:hypothetical protein